MNTVLNIIWLVLSGFWLFLGYLAAGVIMCVLIVTIPWGIASFRIGLYALWPFGRTVVAKPTSGAWSFIGNVIWFLLAGIWLAIAHLISGVLLCITIIGIPLGIADFKLIPVSLAPLGKEIVDI
ncbi:YccF domain-containing protein [Agromyces sp. Marseille-Q5079]|uniref:YccF domain-containing protein n=1 Tax=Agromyces sp. Marseille-Q5079 TaxID=3439059 RepID=UPI003D9C8BAF